MSGETKAAIISGLIVALGTSIANWFVTQSEIKANFDTWKAKHEQEQSSIMKQKARNRLLEIINFYRLASNKMSEHNENLVEYHFYYVVSRLSGDEKDPIVLDMRNKQISILSKNRKLINGYYLHVSDYESRITYLGIHLNDDCHKNLLSTGRIKLNKKTEFIDKILIAMEKAPDKKAQRHEFLYHLKSNIFREFISFDEEVSHFNKLAMDCFKTITN